MPRPSSKDDLLAAAVAQYDRLGVLLASMSDEQLRTPFAFEDRDRCVRDVVVHLHEWHNLLLLWVESNLSGQTASFLPSPYNWRTYSAMNVEFRDRHQDTSMEDALELLADSHAAVLALIENFDDEDLFTKKRFPWTGGTTLGSYCVSATSSHYDWAVKKLRKHLSR